MTCKGPVAIAANTQRQLKSQTVNASRGGTRGSHPAPTEVADGECRVPSTPLIASAESSVKGTPCTQERAGPARQPVGSKAPPSDLTQRKLMLQMVISYANLFTGRRPGPEGCETP